MYIDIPKVLSYNCLWNFLIGPRDVGKTYGTIKEGILRSIKRDTSFIYVRRFDSEIKGKVPTLFQKLKEKNEFPNNELKVKGRKFFIDDKYFGEAVPLSKQISYKSTSFKKPGLILFDEFLIDDGTYRYLPNECIQFMKLYDTICRETHPKPPVIFTGNAESIINPYFSKLDITIKDGQTRYRDEEIYIEMVKGDSEFIERQENDRFSKIAKRTEYYDFAVNNNYLVGGKDEFIQKKSSKAKFIFYIKHANITLGFWVDYDSGLTCSLDYEKTSKMCYVTKHADQRPNMMLIKEARNTHFLKMLIKAYNHGYLYYDSERARAYFQEVAKYIIGGKVA